MRFSCGESAYHRAARLEEWHPYFALRPKTVGVENGKDVCVWLQWIWRRRRFIPFFIYGSAGEWIWEYRERLDDRSTAASTVSPQENVEAKSTKE